MHTFHSLISLSASLAMRIAVGFRINTPESLIVYNMANSLAHLWFAMWHSALLFATHNKHTLTQRTSVARANNELIYGNVMKIVNCNY